MTKIRRRIAQSDLLGFTYKINAAFTVVNSVRAAYTFSESFYETAFGSGGLKKAQNSRKGCVCGSRMQGYKMCARNIKTLVGVGALCFSIGVIASYIFPGFIIAFIESAVLIAAGILLIKR